MKIEMGESLFYSWLRHVKSCQVVQTNWKPSSLWECPSDRMELLAKIKQGIEIYYNDDNFNIFKQSTLDQILSQTECDVVGMELTAEAKQLFHAIDVAFHENGLQYGDKYATSSKVISKCARIAMCLYGYLNVKEAEIIFATPKIHKATLEILKPRFDALASCIKGIAPELNFKFRLFVGEDFRDSVLGALLKFGAEISDTSELFLRSWQLLEMFGGKSPDSTQKKKSECVTEVTPVESGYSEMKIGLLARGALRHILVSNKVGASEIEQLLKAEASKEIFGLNYPALVSTDSMDVNLSCRYYVDELEIQNKKYRLCNDWYEKNREKLVSWLKAH